MSTTTSPRPRRLAPALPSAPIAHSVPTVRRPGPTPVVPIESPAPSAVSIPTWESESADERLRRLLYFTRTDGTSCFASGDAPKVVAPPPRMLSAELRSLAPRALKRNGRPASAFKGPPKPAASFHSETGRCSLLRTDWSAGGAQLAVDWSTPELQLEFCVGRDVVFAGRAAPEVTVGGTLRRPTGDWSEVVWLSDVDAEYLELEIPLAGGVRLQRQYLLTRRDGWFYTAEVVFLGTSAAGGVSMEASADIGVRLSLPCVEKARLTPAEETCEATLAIGRRQLAIVPPALPEWRSANRQGGLGLDGGDLAMRMTARRARALYVPLAVQFDAARARKPLTWRQLTVGENLSIVPADRAAGYRLQFGREHWLVYRSLTPRANRTVLGVNLQTDFLFSRFSTEGESEPLIEIES